MNADRASYDELSSPNSISPLPNEIHKALPFVAAMGIVSLITTSLLLFRLCWIFVRKLRTSHEGVNQFLILIFNLIIADIQQAIAFTINAHWLSLNSIQVNDGLCWTQGWFISTGDLSSGVFTLAIAVHAFADVVFGRKLSTRAFCLAIAGCWAFVYLCSIVGISLHSRDFFARAGPWCFINGAYNRERLLLHYLWLVIIELGTLVLYISLVVILYRRTGYRYYASTQDAAKARTAARVMMAYPLIYCICTLPIVSARLVSMSGGSPSYTYLCIGGIFIASNGWLDVLVYTMTRSTAILRGDATDRDAPVLETFHAFGQRFNMVSQQGDAPHLWNENKSVETLATSSTRWLRPSSAAESRASMSLKDFDFELGRARQEEAVAHLHELPGYWERKYSNTGQHPDTLRVSSLPSLYSHSATCLIVSPVEME